MIEAGDPVAHRWLGVESARGQKAIVVTNSVPGHDVGFAQSGHAHYLATFLQRLSANGYDVVLLVVAPQVDFLTLRCDETGYRIVGPAFASVAGRIRLRTPRGIVGALAWAAYSRLPQPLQTLGSWLRSQLRKSRGYAHVLGSFMTAADREYVAATVARERPDLIIYDGVFNACGRLGAGQHWVLTHEVKHQRAESFAQRGVAVYPRDFAAETERKILAEVGNIIAIQWDDEAEFRRLCPTSRVVVFPVAVDIPALLRARRRASGRCLFVGSGSFHNVDGIRWFLHACWPAVRRQVPDAILEIYGTVCLRLGEVPAGVYKHGVAPNLAAAYADAGLAIVPLRIGSGLKVKLVEALANGTPVVTTSVGAQGLSGIVPQPFLVADDADAFADACTRLMSDVDLAADLSTRALACAQRFEPARAFAPFAQAMRDGTPAHARSPFGSTGPRFRICVAVPTYRRPARLAILLDALGAQDIDTERTYVEIIVLDNDAGASAQEVVRGRNGLLPFPLRYEGVPRPGLAMVRNRALTLAADDFDFIAMIDDDEVPDARWLSELVRVATETRAEVVVGPVLPILPASAPAWMSDLRAKETPIAPDGAFVREGWSCNALVALEAVRRANVTFDPALNFAGGEDQLFFRQLGARGARFAFAAHAVVHESISGDRLTLRFNLLRAFRRGNSLAFCERRMEPGLRTLVVRTLKAGAVISLAVARLPLVVAFGERYLVARLCDIARGLGMFGGLAGTLYQAYRQTDVSAA